MLTQDIPVHHLRAGDIAVLVDYVPHPEGGEEGCILEVFNVLGDSIAVVAVPLSAIAPLRADQVRSARSLVRSS